MHEKLKTFKEENDTDQEKVQELKETFLPQWPASAWDHLRRWVSMSEAEMVETKFTE